LIKSGTVDMQLTKRVCAGFCFVIISAGMLGGCNDDGSSASSAATSSGLAISGTPEQSVAVDSKYSFEPTVHALDGVPLSFGITNKPSWAIFDSTTGALSGTPAVANIGSTAQIVITVSNGTSTASLAEFKIDVTASTAGTAALSWAAPVLNSSGSNVELAGYQIYYGNEPTNMTHVITISSVAETAYTVSELSAGTWYFAITAFDTAHVESNLSAIVSVSI
jgi:Putative Ig domain